MLRVGVWRVYEYQSPIKLDQCISPDSLLVPMYQGTEYYTHKLVKLWRLNVLFSSKSCPI